MNTLYIVASLENWPDTMIQAVDSTGEKLGPTEGNSKINMFFFMVFILVGSFFFLNFFIGVLFLKFNQAKQAELKGYSSKDLGWQDIQKLILTAEPEYESTNVPKEPWRKTFHELVSSNEFDVVIMLCIVLNMIQMAMSYETQSEEFS
jgi:NADH:ubiquinone oxidoreductase subunit 3 (subunit A)